MATTLEDKLLKIKERIENQLPAEAVKIMHQATADLTASGISDNILNVSDKAPEFSLVNHKDEKVSSIELLKKGPLIITFYRGVWCPYCNADLAHLKKFKDEMDKLGATMISLSPQLQENNIKIVETQRLNYDLLRDTRNEIAAAFGLRWSMVDPLKSLYDSFGINLPKFNGEGSWTLPVPARFIIDQNGIIRYAEFSVDYTQRPNPDILIDELKKL